MACCIVYFNMNKTDLLSFMCLSNNVHRLSVCSTIWYTHVRQQRHWDFTEHVEMEEEGEGEGVLQEHERERESQDESKSKL
jgi:hypothetical protein